MAEALVSVVGELLGSIMVRELRQEVRLVVGVEEEVDKLTSNLTAIQAVLAEAETRQVKEATVRDWLEKLKDVVYDIEDVLDDWEAAILSSRRRPGDEQVVPKIERKVCSFLRSSCFCCKQVGLRHDIANKIKELNERLDRVAMEKERYHFVPKEAHPTIERPMTTSMIDITEVKGREEDKRILMNMLLSETRNGDRSNLCVISIVGMGGIGKTTLAKFAFNHSRMEAYFDKKIWICVSDPFDETRVAEAILESLLGHAPNVKQLQGLLEKIGECVKDKKFLLVLDDVWEENSRKWDQLKQSLSYGSPGSKVLVTTRKENVASVMSCSIDNILKAGTLSDEECWSIMSKIAFFGRSDTCKHLEEIGRKIATKCRGLPLTAKALGGILRFRKTREEWESILESEIWEVEEAQRDVIVPLWLSYHDLSPTLKRCFSYCAIFPKDYQIEKRTLIEFWMAQGYLKQRQRDDLEVIGEYCFQNLAMRSFFQDFEKDKFDDIYSCKMHDIVHDFAQIVAQSECVSVQGDGQVESIMGSVSRKVRHLSLTLSNCTPSSDTFKGLAKMRSLLFLQSGGKLSLTQIGLSSLFSELIYVRSLCLRYGDFAEIPSSIGKLVHLRCLDLSDNGRLKQLPETLCELHNLQTIDVSGCRDLELPHGIGQLVNLKHLHNYSITGGPRRLPKGVVRLTGLRTLERVDVGCDGDAFSLGDLKNLNQLRRSLIVKNLGAYDHHVGEAKQAELKKKEHVTCLGFVFTLEPQTAGNEELLDGLEPSPNLEILSIFQYRGTTFPIWIISLTNLRDIQLSRCQSCEQLPSLGKLPSLEALTLWEMDSVKKVGLELLGIEMQSGDSKSVSSSSPAVAFPRLAKLEFYGMRSWEEWGDYNDYYAKPAIIMPSLRSLEIRLCTRLKALPNYILQNTMLHTLEIDVSNILRERYNKEKGEDWSKISHISDVRIYY